MTRNIKGKHMFRTLLGGKIHRATVTEADLNYVGSITIDPDLMDAAGICVNEKVAIVNNNNGARLRTYTDAARLRLALVHVFRPGASAWMRDWIGLALHRTTTTPGWRPL